ncbi:MAG: hypothetical protein ACREA2_11115 [Blastocatellia bacterium]
MAANQRDLWPAISTPTNAGFPVAILREQAALLQNKTRGLVTAEVLSGTGVPLTSGELGEQYIFHAFYLVAPLLEHYRYRLFTVEHSKLEQMYPLIIRDSPVGEVKVDTEERFVEELKKIFTDDKTQKIIQALIAQSPLE